MIHDLCQPITKVGQIKKNDVLVIEKNNGIKFLAIAREIINEGAYDEEILLSKGKNYYFIVSKLADGTSWVKSVTKLKDVQATALINNTNSYVQGE